MAEPHGQDPRVNDPAGGRRWFVREVIQTSAMDCGPASLSCLLAGFGIHASYGRLREACQTDIDGSSIDTLEEVANQLGLVAEQVIIPADHLVLPEAGSLPALVVVRLANGATHFVVVWRRYGPLLELMDPGVGRRWVHHRRFLGDLYRHQVKVAADDFADWASTPSFIGPLARRIRALGVSQARARELSRSARDAAALAALDAGVRMTSALVEARALRRGRDAEQLARRLAQRASAEPHLIPNPYWFAKLDASPSEVAREVTLSGAVVLQVRGRRPKAPALGLAAPPREMRERARPEDETAISPELVAALAEPPPRPYRELFRWLLRRPTASRVQQSAQGCRADGALLEADSSEASRRESLVLVLTAFGILMAALGAVIELVALRGALDLARELGARQQRLISLGALLALFVAVTLVEVPVAASLLGMGRRFEARLRTALLQKIPLLCDRYFQSRLVSDMAERGHALATLRVWPELLGDLTRVAAQIVITAIGIVLLDPAALALTLTTVMLALAVPLLGQPLLMERDLRARTHNSALGRFYLDALLGLAAIRSHGAEAAMKSEQQALLVEWARAATRLHHSLWSIEALQTSLGFALAAWLVVDHVLRAGNDQGALLLAYWALSLPVLGRELVFLSRQLPQRRNVALRVLEPLGAPDSAADLEAKRGDRPGPESAAPSRPAPAPGVSIEMRGVCVRAAGHSLLEEIELVVTPGAHLAIVGESGSGKSTLLGLLLGWHRTSRGVFRVDGCVFDPQRCLDLRRVTSWVDPSVQLFQASLFDNLLYGSSGAGAVDLSAVVEMADLRPLLARLPEGFASPLGEGGGLVSGGEGQRVRFGRALLKASPRLVLLDEPFRGLDREQRQLLLDRARKRFRNATLLCTSHDITATLDFDWVIVMTGGRIAEQGRPRELRDRSGSAYQSLLEDERRMREHSFAHESWRRLRVDGGRLVELPRTRDTPIETATVVRSMLTPRTRGGTGT